MSRLDPNDTIAAISSPPGPAHRGIVRLSGPAAFAIALADFTPHATTELAVRHAVRMPGALHVGGLHSPLPADLSLWPAPATYTGGPIAEIHTLGAPPILDAVLAACIARGARLAEPGEFTLRAFLSGKLDLTKAEAVLAVIEARDAPSLEAALAQLAGGVTASIRDARDRLLDVLAHVEAGLDFVDEADVDPIAREALARSVDEARAQIGALTARFSARDHAGSTARAVLLGPPNAGKSRLFNALAGDDRAIVSPVAGTTRDWLSAPIDCCGRTVELIDTAGLEVAFDPITAAAQSSRSEQSDVATIRLKCRSADTPTAPPDPGDATIPVWTKLDLSPAPSGFLPVCALTGQGLDALRARIRRLLDSLDRENDPLAATAARCRGSLERASTSLASAASALRLGLGDELVAIDLRQALDDLGAVVGETVDEDILDRIFARFCVGK